MRPSSDVNERILGVLGRAQAMYKVEIYLFVFLSNHFHLLIRVDSVYQQAAFVGFLKANLAKELGALHDWREKFWGRRYHSACLADSEATQIARLHYIVSNSCKEGLVSSPLEWPGVSAVSTLCRGEWTMRGVWYDRTAEHTDRLRGIKRQYPSVETVRLSPLPFLEGRSQVEQRQFIVDAVRRVEEETREQHTRNRTRPLGVHAVQRQHPHTRPENLVTSSAPIFHASTREEYLQLREARAVTVGAYRMATEQWMRGVRDVLFPVGCFPPPPPPAQATRAPPAA